MIKKIATWFGYREWKLVEMAVFVDITYKRYICSLTGREKEVVT